MTTVLLVVFAAWVALCLSSLVGKVAEFVVQVAAVVVVLSRIARAVEAQNTHYGVATAKEDDDAPVR